jgi:F0F1-type ATP synthase membrane subunit b/b'
MLKIPPDITFVYQIGLFLILWFLMKRLWVDPALRVIRERASRSEGAVQEARAIQDEAGRLRAEHAAALAAARGEAQREMQEILRGAEAEQKRLIAEARAEAERTLDEARARMAEDVATARRALLDSAGELARMVAQKVLGRAA